jgi:hypothetical protein
MEWIIKQIRKEEWSPYAAGILLGVVGVLAVWLADSLLGASGAFENLAGLLGKALAPRVFDNLYFNFVMPPGITWSVILLVGVFFGGLLGAANGSASLAPRCGSVGWWVLLVRSSWNTPPASPVAAPAAWPSQVGCCSFRLPSCLSPVCSLQASSPPCSSIGTVIRGVCHVESFRCFTTRRLLRLLAE